MKSRKVRSFFLGFFFLVLSVGNYAQVNPGRIEELLKSGVQLKKILLQYPAEVKEVYQALQYQPVWIGNRSRLQELLEQLKQPDKLGLKTEDYQHDFIRSFLKDNPTLVITGDSLAAEFRFTDAAIHFFKDLVYGNTAPQLGYNGLKYVPACLDIPQLLASAIISNHLHELPFVIGQKTPEYVSVKELIGKYITIISDTGFREIKISSHKVNSSNRELLIKLYQLGILNDITQKLPDTIVKEKIKMAQQLFNLSTDGKLGSSTLAALNIPLKKRLEDLNSAINTIRWLFCIKQSEHVVIVNIPSATLLVYEQGKAILESRIIVGKPSTRTPTLCSKITEVILYPYWMVPYSIATKELLPSIKKNAGYINANGYQVVDRQGRIVNPYKINWQSLSRSNFPYIIRQSTGCDNALGLIKLNFYNPFSVYLHDTPTKNLFKSNKRFYSHGCMRVEKAMELGHLVLKTNSIAIDTLEQKGCLRNQSPIIVPADEIIPVFVLYNTIWTDAQGKISFYPDIYRKTGTSGRKD